MKRITLSSAQYREWRENVPWLVDAEARPIRKARPQEVDAEFQARQNRRLFRLLYQGEPVSIVPGREVMRRKLLAVHGECQVRAYNGRVLCIVRDPSVERPKFTDSVQLAPHPDLCVCRQWGSPHPGRHHEICEWNRYAPGDQRGDIVVPRRVHAPTMDHRLTTRGPDVNALPVNQRPRVIAEPQPPEPAACVCRRDKWQTVPGDDPELHHPVCQWYEAHKRARAAGPQQYIIDLDSGEPLRQATNAEVTEAAAALAEGGASLITIGTDQYAVGPLPTDEAAQNDAALVIEAQPDEPIESSDTEPPPPTPVVTETAPARLTDDGQVMTLEVS